MKLKKMIALALCSALLTVSLSGCTIKDKLLSLTNHVTSGGVFMVGDDSCPENEAKMILLNYQKEYSSLYSIDVWAHEEESDDESSLETYIKDLTISQLAKVYTMDQIAADQEIELSSSEKKLAREAAKAYYSGLDNSETAYLGATQSDCETLFERYALAAKVYDTITANIDPEVSDDEAHVSVVDEICTSDPDSAAAALTELNNGTDFKAVAATYNESDVYQIQVDRSTFSDSIVETIFHMTDDTYSDVISSDDGNYYIFYCESSYEPDLTEAHKADVLQQRKEEAVSEVYDEYLNSISSTLNDSTWENIRVDTSLSLQGDSFLTVYNSYFTAESGDES